MKTNALPKRFARDMTPSLDGVVAYQFFGQASLC